MVQSQNKSLQEDHFFKKKHSPISRIATLAGADGNTSRCKSNQISPAT